MFGVCCCVHCSWLYLWEVERINLNSWAANHWVEAQWVGSGFPSRGNTVLDQFNKTTLSDLVQIIQLIFSHVSGKRDVGKWTSVFQLINNKHTRSIIIPSVQFLSRGEGGFAMNNNNVVWNWDIWKYFLSITSSYLPWALTPWEQSSDKN